MSATTIEQGDIVYIEYNDGTPEIKRTVVNVPSQTGEHWVFIDPQNGELIYQNPMASNFVRVVRPGRN